MKNLCEKHHLTYTAAHCPMCEKERITSFKVSKNTAFVVPGQASRESYYDEYIPDADDSDTNYGNLSDNDLADLLASKFGNVTINTKKQ